MKDDLIVSPPEFAVTPPKRIMRPCDYGLEIAVRGLVTQLGTIEAYNRLVARALAMKADIDAGTAQAASSFYQRQTGAIEE